MGTFYFVVVCVSQHLFSTPPPSPLSGFSSITQKREKLFSSNLATFFIDKWVTICSIKIEDRPFHVAIVMAQIKGAQIWHFQKNFFSILTIEMKAVTIKVSSTNYQDTSFQN